MWIIETREEHKHTWNTNTCGTQTRVEHKHMRSTQTHTHVGHKNAEHTNTRVDRVQSYFNFETGITTGL